MKLEHLTWDYNQPLEDELWRARRMAELFPFILEELTPRDKMLLLSKLDELRLPAERKEFIRMVCHEKQNPV